MNEMLRSVVDLLSLRKPLQGIKEAAQRKQ